MKKLTVILLCALTVLSSASVLACERVEAPAIVYELARAQRGELRLMAACIQIAAGFRPLS